MNSGEVAKLLGVSVSTVQRWVKQLNLPMERNERGHYIFKAEDVESLRKIQAQIQRGILLQEIAAGQETKQHMGVEKKTESDQIFESFAAKISELEVKLNDKADSVATYQLLQHRREIEDLQNQVKNLLNRIEKLEEKTQNSTPGEEQQLEQNNKRRKKKNVFRSLLGL